MMSPNLFGASFTKGGKLFLVELNHGRTSYRTISYRLIEMILCQYRLLLGNVYFRCIQNHLDIPLKLIFDSYNHSRIFSKLAYF